MEDQEEKKNLLNMPNDELSATLKRLSRYTLAVEAIALAGCLPLITKSVLFLLAGTTFCMIMGIIFMRLCEERRKKRWIAVEIAQLVFVILNIIAIFLYGYKGLYDTAKVMLNISMVFIWIHCALCVFDYRKEEELPYFRFAGAFIVLVTAVVCFIAHKVLAGNSFFNFL